MIDSRRILRERVARIFAAGAVAIVVCLTCIWAYREFRSRPVSRRIEQAVSERRPRLQPIAGMGVVPDDGLVEAIALGAHADLVEWSAGVLRRRDGRDAAVVWERDLKQMPRTAAVHGPPWNTTRGAPPSAELLHPAPDLDGDHTGDLVWVSRRAPCVLAFAAGTGDAAKGTLLWAYTGRPGTKLPAIAEDPPTPTPTPTPAPSGRVVGMPAIADLDHDGVSDLIVTFLVDEPGAPLGLACWVDALSGRTGRPLWRVPLERIPRPDLAQAAALLSMQGTPTVGVLSDYEWRGYDPATAAQWKSRYNLGFLPVRPPLYDDLNGDGQPELLLVREPVHYPARGLSIRALGPPWRPLWEVNVGGLSRNPSAPLNPRDPWPTVVDLDPNDGERNVLIPDDTTRGVRALHGTTGEPRWQRLLSNGEDEAAGTNTPAPVSIDGPDLDGDGIREVFTASFFWDQARGSTSLLGDRDVTGLYVDALSGRDGRSLWWSRQPVDRVFPIHAHLQWWQDAPDGGPLLVVSVGHSNTPLARDAGAEVFLLAAKTGALKRPIQGLAWPRLADFNGDGRDDLWGLVGGRVCVLPGERPAAPGPRPEPPHVAVRLDGAARPDPRLWRPLPWVPAFPIPLTFVPVIAVLGLLVWVIPLRLLRRGVRTAPKGRRMPGIALGLALAVAIVVGTYLALPPDRIQRLFEGVELYQILLALAVILPIVVISGWVVWRRGVGVPLHFPVRLSPVLWICLAIAIVEAAYVTAVISERPTGPRPGLIGLLVMAALGVPVVVLVDAFGGALLRRDWRRLEWLVGLVLVFALAIVATTLALDLPRKSPAEHYLWERWYTVLYPALYLTGLSLLVFRGVTSLVRRAARWIDARPVRSKKKLDDLAEL